MNDPERPSPDLIEAMERGGFISHEAAVALTNPDNLRRHPFDCEDAMCSKVAGFRCVGFRCDTPNACVNAGECHEITRQKAQAALAAMDAHLPPDAAERKAIPIATGCIDYFPDALAAVARLSKIGNEQHNPGKPLHWDRSKSGDEADALGRHFLDRGTFDNDGVRHSAKVAWRALALLQKEIEEAKARLQPIFKEASHG